MKDQILKYVAEHPGCRARNVASALGKWVCDVAIEMCFLAEEGVLRSETYSDPAQMEQFNKWYLAED